MAKRLLLLNGSVRGSLGNTGVLLRRAAAFLPVDWQSESLTLADYEGSVSALADRLREAGAVLVGTGTYWGSWGSPLQRFLEVISAYELSPCFLGKPVGAVVSADSIGGLDIAQRLLGAFSLLGCLIPPLSTLVVSRVGVAATQSDAESNEDVWQPADLEIVVRNLVVAEHLRELPWASWPVRNLAHTDGDFTAHGPLAAGLEKFL